MRNYSLCCLAILLCGYHSFIHAATSAAVYAVQPSVWLKLADKTQALNPGDAIEHGSVIVTDEGGRIEIRIDDVLQLQQNTNSELVLTQVAEDSSSSSQTVTNLMVRAGKSCIQFRSTPSLRRVIVELGSTMTITLYDSGAICVLHQDGLSSVHLREGSIQINHSVDPNIIVLSERGSEFQVEFGESYSVLRPELAEVYYLASEGFPLPPSSLTASAPEPQPEPVVAVETVEPEVAETTAAEPAPEVEVSSAVQAETTTTPSVSAAAALEPAPAPQVLPSYDGTSKYVFTVYLFSTRELEVAEQANARFRKAGYPSEIYSTESAETSRHRVVVTGFSSRESAQVFSDSIVGKHGIADTWIGRDRRRAPE